MSDLNRIMERKVEEPAFLVWNGEVVITINPSEFPRMRKIIEQTGEHNFADEGDGSYSVQLAWFRDGEDVFDKSCTVDEFEQYLATLDV